jgi:hypothetical protein
VAVTYLASTYPIAPLVTKAASDFGDYVVAVLEVAGAVAALGIVLWFCLRFVGEGFGGGGSGPFNDVRGEDDYPYE